MGGRRSSARFVAAVLIHAAEEQTPPLRGVNLRRAMTDAAQSQREFNRQLSRHNSVEHRRAADASASQSVEEEVEKDSDSNAVWSSDIRQSNPRIRRLKLCKHT